MLDPHDDERPGGRRRSTRTPGRLRRGLRRLSVLGTVPTMAAATLAVLASPAEAVLDRMGPVDPATGFPAWYADSDGLALQLCLDGPPLCLASATDLLDTGDEGEAFWFAADTTAGKMDAHLALEAAYIGVGQPTAFMRHQFQADGLEPGATYKVTDPWRSYECVGADDGGRTRCRFEFGSTFETAMTVGPMGPFLTWDTFGSTGAGAPPAGYIGDGATPHPVVGSPNGFNKVRVEGPNINDSGTDLCPDVAGPIADCAESDLFVLQGKLAPGAAARVSTTTVDMGNVSKATTQQVIYSSLGSEPVTVGVPTIAGPGAGAFAVTGNTCTAPVQPGTSCVLDVTYTPVSGQSASATMTVGDGTPATTQTVQLRGSSVAVSTVNRSSLSLGRHKVRTRPSAAKVVLIRNTGVAPLRIDSIASTRRDFRVAERCPVTLAIGRSCRVQVRFAPVRAGLRTADLRITDSTGVHDVRLRGTGTQPRIRMARGLAFGRTAVGGDKARAVRVRNTGNALLVIGRQQLRGRNHGQFRLGGATLDPCRRGLRVRPGQSCKVVVRFVPRTQGAKRATLTVRGDGQARSIRLFGKGTRR